MNNRKINNFMKPLRYVNRDGEVKDSKDVPFVDSKDVENIFRLIFILIKVFLILMILSKKLGKISYHLIQY